MRTIMNSNTHRTRHRKIMIKDEVGVSNIVGAIMMMGFLISIFSVVYAYYIPDKGSNLEADNIKDIKYQFSSFNDKISSSISQEDIGAISTMDFNLGSEGYILGTSLESFGAVEFSPNENEFNLRSSNNSINFTSSGLVSYESQNMYYENSYIYYNWGMSSISTYNSDGIITDLPFSIEYHNDNLYLDIVMVDLTGNAKSASGMGVVSIKGTVNLVWNTKLSQTNENISFTLDNANELSDDIALQLSLDEVSENDYNITEDENDLVLTFYQVYKLNVVYASVGVTLVV